MIQNSEQRVQVPEQSPPKAEYRLHWDDLDIFTTLAEVGSFRAAATRLNMSVNTVRSHLDRLEKSIASTLFLRDRLGVTLSVEGQSMLSIALEMQSASARARFRQGNHLSMRNGELRIGCSEGIGEFWLTPSLPELQSLVPDLTVSLRNEFDQAKVHDPANDVRLGFVRPTENNVIVSRLGTLHFMMYASPGYIERYGTPNSINDAQYHRFVIQDAPGLHSDAISLFLGGDLSSRVVQVKVNTSFSLYRAVANGVGIGALPTYVRAIARNVIPLDLPIQLKFDLWLSYNPALRHSVPVSTTIEWLRQRFSGVRYPWFADNFIHPNDFEDILSDSNIVELRQAFG